MFYFKFFCYNLSVCLSYPCPFKCFFPSLQGQTHTSQNLPFYSTLKKQMITCWDLRMLEDPTTCQFFSLFTYLLGGVKCHPQHKNIIYNVKHTLSRI